MQNFQRWMRTFVVGDLSYAATLVTVLALGCHYAGHMTAAALFGVVGAGLVALKFHAKRRAVKN